MRWIESLLALLILGSIWGPRAQVAPRPGLETREASSEAATADRPGEGEQGADSRRSYKGSRNVFGQDITVRADETVRDLVLLGGKADIQGTVERDVVVIGGSVNVSGEIEGDLIVIGGSAKVSGTIQRDLRVILGGLELSDTGRIERDAVLIGGPFRFSEKGYIGGERVSIPLGDVLPKIEWLKAWFLSGPLLGRLLSFSVGWPWVIAGFTTILYLLTLLAFPGAVKAVYTALEQRPVASIIAGLLTMILHAPLVVVLVITIVGIVAIPFVKVALILALIFGKVGVICFFGRSVGRAAGASFLQAPFFAFVLGTIVLTLAYTVPVIGILVWLMATVFGLGGAIMAISARFAREEGSVPPAPVALSTLRPGISGTGPSPTPSGASGEPGSAPPPALPSLAALGPNDTLLLPRAGFWIRFVAAALDLILLSLLIPLTGPFFIPVAIIYFVAMWTWKGTTIGSIVFGLKIVRTDGGPVTLAVAIVRGLSSLFSALVLFLGFLWAGWDREKQTWHDKIAGTVVVKMPKGFALL